MVKVRRGTIQLLFALRVRYILDIAPRVVSYRRQKLFQRNPILANRSAFLTIVPLLALLFLISSSFHFFLSPRPRGVFPATTKMMATFCSFLRSPPQSQHWCRRRSCKQNKGPKDKNSGLKTTHVKSRPR